MVYHRARPTGGAAAFLVAQAATLFALATPTRAAVQRQPDSLLSYVPSLGGNVTFGVLYTVACVAFFYHIIRWRKKYLLVLPIATLFEALGWWVRVVAREPKNQSVSAIYIVWYIFIVLAPAGFLAFNYIVYGRLIVASDPELVLKPGMRAKSRYSFIPPRIVARIFICSDIVTFLVQAAGGALQVSGGKLQKPGDHTFLVGVTLQGVSYLLFTALTLVAHQRLWIVGRDDYYRPWNLRSPAARLFATLYVSSFGILVRSFYRIIEMAYGYSGYLYREEIYLLVLDALPLIIAIGVFVPFWPHAELLAMQEHAEQVAGELRLERKEEGAVAATNSADGGAAAVTSTQPDAALRDDIEGEKSVAAEAASPTHPSGEATRPTSSGDDDAAALSSASSSDEAAARPSV